MTLRRVEVIGPGTSSGQARLHTLQNGIIRARLYSVLFGKAGQTGYLSPLGFCTNNLELALKMKTALFSLVENFSPGDNRLTSVLRQAAEALRIEIFEQPWTENHLFTEERMEVFNWKTTAKTIPEFIKDCEAVLEQLGAPLFGGLPNLAAELAKIAQGPGPDQQQDTVNRFMSSIDHTRPLDSVVSLMQLLDQKQLVSRNLLEETIRRFHELKPIRPMQNEEAAILEAKAYVMGVVIRATNSVTAFRNNWFASLGFDKYHTDEIKDLMIKMGFGSEWHSFDIDFQKATRPTV